MAMEAELAYRQNAPLERESGERVRRQALHQVAQNPDLTSRTALAVIALSDEIERRKPLALKITDTLNAYGLRPDDLNAEDLETIGALINARDATRKRATQEELSNAENRIIHRILYAESLKSIDALSAQLDEPGPDAEALKQTVRSVMQKLSCLSKTTPAEDPAYADKWNELFNRYKRLIDKKLEKNSFVSRCYSEVFQEFNDFIDNDFALSIYRYYQQVKNSKTKLPEVDDMITNLIHQAVNQDTRLDLERVTQIAYGRTREEVDEIKSRNRELAAGEVRRLANEPELDVDDIVRLHKINNAGISPRPYSRLRYDKNTELESFGKRKGTLPEDVQDEMDAWIKRVNLVLDQSQKENWTDVRYEIAVAQLHNQILDIHPFLDRNGSTSLLFMETMMAKRGYQPNPKRENGNFYNQVRKVLGNNPIAVAIVGYEMSLIGYVTGYYKGVTAKGKEEEYKKRYKL